MHKYKIKPLSWQRKQGNVNLETKMSDKAMKIILSVLTGILLILIIGLFAFKGGVTKVDLNKIALRIGELRQYRTMNRADMNTMMEKAFSRLGYNVVSSTEDNLYPSVSLGWNIAKESFCE